MATGGLVQYTDDGQLYDRLANFSTFYPFLIWLVGNLVTPVVAPFVINTLFTIPVPWLAAKFAPKLVLSSESGPTVDQAWRQRLIVLGISLNPIFLGYSIYGLTEPVFYLLLLVALNCNQREGGQYIAGELVALFFMGWTKYTTLLIAAFYAYQGVMRDLLNKDYKRMLRPAACIACVGVNFLFWNYWFPLQVWGITATAAMEKWWKVRMGFPPDSMFFGPKLGIVALAVAGILMVARMLSIRKGWTLLGFKDRYLQDLKKVGRNPAMDGLVDPRYANLGQDGQTGPYNYELVEALFFYGYCVFGFHGLVDPLFSFFRYVSIILPFYACISIQNRFTDNTPAMALWALIGSIGSSVGVFVALLAFAWQWINFGTMWPDNLLPPEITDLYWWPEMVFCIGLLVVVIALFFKYYYAIKAANYAAQPTPPDLRKLTIYLSVASVIMMLVNLYIP